MKNKWIVIVVVVVVLGGLTGWYLAAHKNSKSNDMSNMNMSSGSSASNKAAVATNTVTIQNFAFSPAAITVKEGTTVTWTNKDSVAHTVTETDGKDGPNSGDVNPNATYSFTFKSPGTYHYQCTVHPEMVGTVTVTQ
jgi:plastocyanin